MPYIDSNVFIYPILYQIDAQPKAKYAKEILLEIENGELLAFTSTLTWDEVAWVVSKTMGRSEGIAQGQKLLGFPNLEFINVDDRVLTQAQAFMDEYDLSPRDSIHAASAFQKRGKTILSDDEDFDQVKELKRLPLQ
jgi:predicted nucleic acid-binding protein